MADGQNWPLDSMLAELLQIEAEKDAAKAAAKEAREHLKGIEDREADCRDQIKALLTGAGVIRDTDSKLASVGIRKTPPRLVIEAADQIPNEFFDLEPVRKDDRIKARLLSGLTVPGASLAQSETLAVEWKK